MALQYNIRFGAGKVELHGRAASTIRTPSGDKTYADILVGDMVCVPGKPDWSSALAVVEITTEEV